MRDKRDSMDRENRLPCAFCASRGSYPSRMTAPV